MENDEQPGTGSGSASGSGTGTGSGSGSASGSGTGTGTDSGHGDAVEVGAQFDHEKLEVYRVAREFLVFTNGLLARKLPRDLRDQFDRASSSILFNIGEGAGKTAKADKQRIYEIARGSTSEVATQLDVIHIRGLLTLEQYQKARRLLLRVSQMLSRMVGAPRML